MFSFVHSGIVHYILLCIFVMVELMQNINAIWEVKCVWQHGRGKCNVPTAAENLKGESLTHKRFLGKSGEIRANIPHTPKNWPAPTLIVWRK